jgi:hypothetical protein
VLLTFVKYHPPELCRVSVDYLAKGDSSNYRLASICTMNKKTVGGHLTAILDSHSPIALENARVGLTDDAVC